MSISRVRREVDSVLIEVINTKNKYSREDWDEPEHLSGDHPSYTRVYIFEKASGSLPYIEAVNFANLLQGLSLSTGQCNVKAYDRYLQNMIIAGKANPNFAISHEIGLDRVVVEYEKLDKREDGYTRVIIHPNGEFDR